MTSSHSDYAQPKPPVYEIIGDALCIDGQPVALVTLPEGTLRETVVAHWSTAQYDEGFAAGKTEGFKEGEEAGKKIGYAEGEEAGMRQIRDAAQRLLNFYE